MTSVAAMLHSPHLLHMVSIVSITVISVLFRSDSTCHVILLAISQYGVGLRTLYINRVIP